MYLYTSHTLLPRPSEQQDKDVQPFRNPGRNLTFWTQLSISKETPGRRSKNPTLVKSKNNSCPSFTKHFQGFEDFAEDVTVNVEEMATKLDLKK
jgi:hypothetical protein